MFDDLKVTNELLKLSSYEPFEDPAYNVAERLIILGHLTFNRNIWSASPERYKRYWAAYLENIEGSANTNRVSIWWKQVTENMGSLPLNKMEYRHEKNLLIEPTKLQPSVEDNAVLNVFRREAGYLVDRTRVWVANKREIAALNAQEGVS